MRKVYFYSAEKSVSASTYSRDCHDYLNEMGNKRERSLRFGD